MGKRFNIDCYVEVTDVSKGMKVVTTEDEVDEAYERDAAIPAYISSLRRLGLKGKFTFVYDYPLSTVARFTEVLKPSMTAKDLLVLGAKHYRAIYKAEDAGSSRVAGLISGMLNREDSDGPFGIWGHVIEDLCFETLKVNAVSRTVRFDVGS